MSSGIDYSGGGGGTASSATRTLAIDPSRPIAYWGYLDKTDNKQVIRRLDYTAGGFPTVGTAIVNSVLSDWPNRSTLVYA